MAGETPAGSWMKPPVHRGEGPPPLVPCERQVERHRSLNHTTTGHETECVSPGGNGRGNPPSSFTAALGSVWALAQAADRTRPDRPGGLS